MRDSNYSPDFRVNAQKLMSFYHLVQREDEIDSIVL